MNRYLEQTAAALAAILLSLGSLTLAVALPHFGGVAAVALPVVA